MINFKNLKRKDLKRNLRNMNVSKDHLNNSCNIILTHNFWRHYFINQFVEKFWGDYKCEVCGFYLKEAVWPVKIIMHGYQIGEKFEPITCKEAIIKRLLE